MEIDDVISEFNPRRSLRYRADVIRSLICIANSTFFHILEARRKREGIVLASVNPVFTFVIDRLDNAAGQLDSLYA